RALSMRSWCLCQICTCGIFSKPKLIHIPIQVALLWNLTD
uniref:Uncharacterized protein n=1 Tax=Catagonus wagneri TaxID=51154 RepID=A0A8C3WPL2_9CETA